MKSIFDRIAIIGIGLIGASIAQSVKENKIAKEVVGFFRREKALKEALKDKIVDQGYLDLESAVKGADFIILAVPVYEIIKIAELIKDFIPQNTLITDIGSTKLQIVKKLSKIYPNYIGAHPLAGSEKKGAEFSSHELFDNKITILTPTAMTNPKTTGLMKKFWKSLGAKTVIMNPDIHDEIVSRISHLPHLLMYGLMNMVTDEHLQYASSGFKDSTRIAVSDPNIWMEIFLSNKKYLLKDIDLFIKHLEKYKKFLTGTMEEDILSVITDAADKRKSFQ
ncbi:MAG: prephenate dehydrogenase/arogenate dehydrogenase family protein [Candidatus Saelkia tenebricola]|nr:prephenate dehydrogenase/arogenate dehydrogenase family protein [Candidatus Saelkia tenebricola]